MTAMSALSSNRAEEMEVDNTDDMMKVDWKNGEITWKIDKLDFPKLYVMHAINRVFKSKLNQNECEISIISPLCIITSQPNALVLKLNNSNSDFRDIFTISRRRKNGKNWEKILGKYLWRSSFTINLKDFWQFYLLFIKS